MNKFAVKVFNDCYYVKPGIYFFKTKKSAEKFAWMTRQNFSSARVDLIDLKTLESEFYYRKYNSELTEYVNVG